MSGEAPGGRLRRVVIRSVLVAVGGAAVLAFILFYASTVDVRPPQVNRFILTQHLASDDGVALTTASLEMVFSESVDHRSAQDAFAIKPAVNGAISWSGTTMIFTPARSLPLKTSFSVSLSPGVRDLAGNTMGLGGPFTFRTVGSPSVVATQPGGSATDVPLDATISVTFSTLMDTSSVATALEVVPRTDVDLRWSGERLTIVPRQALLADQEYLVTIGSGATDLAGTPLEDPMRLAFSTVPSSLHARAVVPQDTAQGIAVTTPIAVILDRAIDPSSVNDRLLTVEPAVAGSVSLIAPPGAAGLADTDRHILRFTPSAPLPVNTTFTVTLAPGLRGTDGAESSGPMEWTFTTGASSPSLGNQIVYLSNRSGIANLWAMNPDGSNQHQLSAELSPVTSYAIAPDGRSFVIGDGVRLIEQRADGSARRVLTEAGLVEFDPSYAPDGSAIVFGRADAATGAGLGLWTRPPIAGSAQQVRIPAQSGGPTATATPTTVPSSSASVPVASPAALLRAPRYSPDGRQLAFVDAAGRIGILDLDDGSLTSAVFHAASSPAWLPGGEGILISGLAQVGQDATWADGVLTPGTAVPPLTPGGLRLTAHDRASLRIVEMDGGLSIVQTTMLREGGALPAVSSDGSIAYIVFEPTAPDAGHLWVASPGGFSSHEVSVAVSGYEASVSSAPQAGTLLVARIPTIHPETAPSPSPSAAGSEPPSPSASPSPASGSQLAVAGIWIVDAASGAGRQLTPDGWLPRWQP